MVSENKSLDIAKITPRMYAMSYPSDSLIESMYHNSQEDIAEYLNKNHPKKYLIFNLSVITYDRDKFNNSVITYHWPDHKAPPLYDIFNIILQAYKYLGKDKENVICVHCLAGKGRTGTICCSLLLYGKLLKMNFIRSILPGGKHRIMTDNKCLDIAKITPRMYAMSYPSDSLIESMYHNNQDDIADYLNKYHPKKYLIFNLSGIRYTSEDKFNNSVITYDWPDHKAPPLSDIFNIIYQAYTFLGKDKENVICIHCLAGKGRTGTICCTLLLYGKFFKCSKDANNYFSTKRFKKLDRGVQEPSQVRYIEYFDKMMDSKNFNGLTLKMYEIKAVHITGIKLNEGESITYKFETNYYKEDFAKYYLSSNNGQIVVGDVTINIYRNDVLKAWIFFHTFFINPVNNRLFFNIKDIDPRFLLKQDDYNLMTIEIILYPYFHNNNMNNNFNMNNNMNNNFNNNMNNNFNNNMNNNFNNNMNNHFNMNNNMNNNFNNNMNNNFNNNINNSFNNNMNNNFNNNINNSFNNNMNNNFNNNINNSFNNNMNNNFNNNNSNSFNNNCNNNNNQNNDNYKKNNIDDMITREMNKIKKINQFLYYANTKNPSQFYQENKLLFFGEENDDTIEILNQVRVQTLNS